MKVILLTMGIYFFPPSATASRSDSLNDALERAAQNDEAVSQDTRQIDQLRQQPPSADIARQIEAVTREREAAKQETLQDAARFPGSYEMQRAASRVALHAEDWAAAQATAKRAVALAGSDPEKGSVALHDLSIAHAKGADFAAAAEAAKRGLDLKPTDRHVADSLMLLYQANKGRSSSAGASPAPSGNAVAAPSPATSAPPVQTTTIAAAPPSIRPHLERASSLLGMRDFYGALQAAQRASALEPANADAYAMQAAAWGALKNLSEAMLAISKAIERLADGDPRLPSAYTTRALLKNRGGDHPGAIADTNEAIKRDPAHADAYHERYQALVGLGQKREALADIRKAAEFKPEAYQSIYEAMAADLARTETAPLAEAESYATAWGALVAFAGGELRLAVGALGAVFILLALSLAFAKEGSPMRRLATWLTPAAFAGWKTEASPQEAPTFIGGKYARGEMIGEGGMGAVYEGRDTVLDRRVAIKRLRPELQRNDRERRRFVEEARNVAKLHHDAIIEIYDVVEERAETYIVFEFVDGRTLHSELNQSPGRHLPQRTALGYLRQVADGLDHAHKRGVIHRDFKPSNVMLDENDRVKIMDFGISRIILDTMATTTNTIVGTPVYMAPEQSMGSVNKTMDIYSLGISFYEMLTGGLPFKGDDINAKLEGRFLSPSALLPDLPQAIDAVIAKALAPDPKNRYQTCADFYRAASEALSQPTPT